MTNWLDVQHAIEMTISPSRPAHDGQLFIDAVQPGLVFDMWWSDARTNKVNHDGLWVVLDQPRMMYDLILTRPMIKVPLMVLDSRWSPGRIDDYYCESMGVVPTQQGMWNQRRWITKEDG